MSTNQPKVLSATELDNAFIGDTIQVSLVTPDLRRGLDHLVALGIGPFMVFRLESDSLVDFTLDGEPIELSMEVAFANHGNMMWEVIQPLDGPSVYREFLDAGHQGLHHVAISGGDEPFEERAATLIERGYVCRMSGRAFGGLVPFGYYAPPDPVAPVIEIFEFPEGFAPEPDEWYPAAPPPDA